MLRFYSCFILWVKQLYDSDAILSRHLRQINIKSALYLRLFGKGGLGVRATDSADWDLGEKTGASARDRPLLRLRGS
ncbi:hypothetical protein QT971_01650 [Microcoleus sp. herbarium19]|uniref:hypothetical protein n=1 Tax=unclassified Microcoleus TaxID=2642155 RepID=UPI002FD71AB7